nr:Hypothetical protein [Aeromonas caviae]
MVGGGGSFTGQGYSEQHLDRMPKTPVASSEQAGGCKFSINVRDYKVITAMQ